MANKSGALMVRYLTVNDACQGLSRTHTLQKNEKGGFTGLTDVKMIPASVRAEPGRHTARQWQAKCVKAAVCLICCDLL